MVQAWEYSAVMLALFKLKHNQLAIQNYKDLYATSIA